MAIYERLVIKLVCPRCMNMKENKSGFCSCCGEKLVHRSVNVRVCSFCGKEVKKRESSCKSCGPRPD